MMADWRFVLRSLKPLSLRYTKIIIVFLVSYPEEREVSAAVDTRDLKVPHHNFAVLVVLPESAILLLQVRQRAQLILRTGTH